MNRRSFLRLGASLPVVGALAQLPDLGSDDPSTHIHDLSPNTCVEGYTCVICGLWVDEEHFHSQFGSETITWANGGTLTYPVGEITTAYTSTSSGTGWDRSGG